MSCALEKRFARKLAGEGFTLTREEVRTIKGLLFAAIKEEVEARFGRATGQEIMDEPNRLIPLRIEGFGTFKLRTRPAREFDSFRYRPDQAVDGRDGPRPRVLKPPARRLAFSAPWYAIEETAP